MVTLIEGYTPETEDTYYEENVFEVVVVDDDYNPIDNPDAVTSKEFFTYKEAEEFYERSEKMTLFFMVPDGKRPRINDEGDVVGEKHLLKRKERVKQ